jgi:hypothetical protein
MHPELRRRPGAAAPIRAIAFRKLRRPIHGVLADTPGRENALPENHRGLRSTKQWQFIIIKAYEEIRKKEAKNDIDEKLFKFLDPNMKSLFAFRFASSRFNISEDQGAPSCNELNLGSEENNRDRSISAIEKSVSDKVEET